MTREELLELIADVQQLQSELDDVEVKSAQGGTPQRLYEPLSAFANRNGGGVLLFGLDESRNFDIIGVGNVQRLQKEISDLAASDYEIFGYVSARTQPTFDEEPIHDAKLEDLDHVKLEDYLAQLKRTRPYATYLNQPFEQALAQLHVVREVDGVLRPTLAGLLMFGKYPQEFEIQMVITFLQYFGTTETEATPRGERFLDNRKFEGTIPEMVDNAVNQVLANIRKSSLIEGIYRQDIPEYPERAVREAIVNAIAHRDYSHFVRGSYIQIRLFADRLEIQSPGGLYGNVTEDTIEHEQSTRNRLLMRMMEDLHLVENRGSGIRAMLEAMRQANLEPPRFQDRRSSFWVTFRNHTLMSPPAITWLNQFAGLPLNDHQRLALVYLRHNEQMTNSDYQRLNHVDSVTANRELRGLVQSGLTNQHSTRRWAYYTLNLPAEEKVSPLSLSNEEKILTYVKAHGSINRAECQQLLGISKDKAHHLLGKMYKRGLLFKKGERKDTRYSPR
jgi:ATP-dependent DNA helicase RecG